MQFGELVDVIGVYVLIDAHGSFQLATLDCILQQRQQGQEAHVCCWKTGRCMRQACELGFTLACTSSSIHAYLHLARPEQGSSQVPACPLVSVKHLHVPHGVGLAVGALCRRRGAGPQLLTSLSAEESPALALQIARLNPHALHTHIQQDASKGITNRTPGLHSRPFQGNVQHTCTAARMGNHLYASWKAASPCTVRKRGIASCNRTRPARDFHVVSA